MKLKPNFPACNIANIIIKAAKADTSRSGDALHHIWYDAEKDAGYATDGKRLLRATAADFGVNRDELKTGYYDLAMIDGYPRFIPVKCLDTFPNVEAVIPVGDAFAEFHYWKKKEADDQSRQKFLLQMLVFHASRKRYSNDPKCWQTLSEARLDAIDKSGTDWQVMIYENTDPISFKHDTIHFVLMPMRGMGDQQVVLKACGLWPEEANESKEN